MGNCVLTKGKEIGGVDLLWTNSGPSPIGAFSVELDLSSYTFVYIVCYVTSAFPNNYASNIIKVGTNGNIVGQEPDGAHLRTRYATITSSGVQFSQGCYLISTGQGVANDSAVPYQIYGVREHTIHHHVTDYNFYGIDTDNVIANHPSLPYTATQDCWFIFRGNAKATVYDCKIYVDGILIWFFQSVNSTQGVSQMVPLKAGQTLSIDNASSYEPTVSYVLGLK